MIMVDHVRKKESLLRMKSENETASLQMTSSMKCGGISAETYRVIEKADSFQEFLEMNKDNMFTLSLSEYLMELLKEKKLKRSDVIRNSGLDEAYVYEIFSGRKKPSRDKLIAVTFGLQLNVQETQRVLKVGGHTELYPRMERDAAILLAVRKQKNIFETDEMLFDNGFPTLLNDAE